MRDVCRGPPAGGSCICCSRIDISVAPTSRPPDCPGCSWPRPHRTWVGGVGESGESRVKSVTTTHLLQLYHELPCGSHGPRQTQQKSALQLWFLQTMWLQPPSWGGGGRTGGSRGVGMDSHLLDGGSTLGALLGVR